mmetsp:Transcript_1104/g.1927  ORF Transcript_1104/g.1927 Transcript_1104/m.1927 type:complete len:212 (+) Transcript_1104:6-641(+)
MMKFVQLLCKEEKRQLTNSILTCACIFLSHPPRKECCKTICPFMFILCHFRCFVHCTELNNLLSLITHACSCSSLPLPSFCFHTLIVEPTYPQHLPNKPPTCVLLLPFLNSTVIITTINQRPHNDTNLLLHHHHQCRTKHTPCQLRSNALIQSHHTTIRQLLSNHGRYGRFHLGIPIRTLQHDLGTQVGVREHGGHDTSDHSQEECFCRRE